MPFSNAADEVTAALALLESATQRLLVTVDQLDPTAMAEPSGLPGWSRAHVLTHLARNADAMRTLLLAARTGVALPQYPSRELRDADITVGALRPPPLIQLDVRASAERFAVDAAHLDASVWAGSVTLASSGPMASAQLPVHRLREVEAHHIDLVAGYTAADTPAEVAAVFLDALPQRFAGTSVDPLTVVATDLGRQWRVGTGDGPRLEGTAGDLMVWALGRGEPRGLGCDRGPVPASPGWG